MNFKKRTKEEVEASVINKDYTGGYDYLPWLIYMRPLYVFGAAANLAAGIHLFNIGVTEPNTVGIVAGLFFITASIAIKLLLIRDFKLSKKGISK